MPIKNITNTHLGEVDHLLALKVDGQRRHRQVSLLVDELADDAVPLAVDDGAVVAVVHRLDRVREVAHARDLLQHLDAEADVLLVAFERLVVLGGPQHHVWRFLSRQKHSFKRNGSLLIE